MIAILSPYLHQLQDSLAYKGETHGIVRTAKDMYKGKIVSFPVVVDSDSEDSCDINKAVIPSKGLTALSYYEMPTGRIEVAERLEYGVIHKCLLTFVYWCVPSKINSNDPYLIDKIMAAEWRRHSNLVVNDADAKITEVTVLSAETDPAKVFAKYNYRTEEFLFENPPFLCFSLLMEVKFAVKCNPIVIAPEC